MSFLADNPAPSELPLPGPLLAIDIGLVFCGLAVISAWIRRFLDTQQRALLITFPARPNRLFPEWVAIPILVFMGSAVALKLIFRLPPDDAGHVEPESLLVGSLSQLVGGVASVVIAALTFEGGWAGYWWGRARAGRQVLAGVLGLTAAYPLCWAIAKLTEFAISMVMPGYHPPQHEVLHLLGQPDLPPWVVPLLWVSAVLVAPLAEEAFFRSVCQSALNHVFKRRWPSIVIMGILFGLSHYTQPHFVPPLIVLGLMLGYVYERTGSLIAPLTLHLLFNLKTMIFFTLSDGAM